MADILAACGLVERWIASRCLEDFLSDTQFQSAVLHQWMIVGEAATRLSKVVKSEMPTILWRDVAVTRNILVNAYFGVDLPLTWTTVTRDLPILVRAIEEFRARSSAKGPEDSAPTAGGGTP